VGAKLRELIKIPCLYCARRLLVGANVWAMCELSEVRDEEQTVVLCSELVGFALAQKGSSGAPH